MKLLILVPRVVRNYIAQFPEVRRNAYKYFNYDNRIIDERVERFDRKPLYQGPDDFNNTDYDRLIVYARTLINPILTKYSSRVAFEDALNLAIRSYNNGQFDGKINAGRFAVLLQAMQMPRFAKKKEEKKIEKKVEKTVIVRPHVLKQLGIKRREIPLKQRVRQRQKGVPIIVQEKGKIVKK